MKIELVKSKKGTGVTGIVPCKTTETPQTTTTTTSITSCDDCNNCDQIQAITGSTVSGVYNSSIGEIFCDMTTDGGGWTVLQQRGDNGNPEDFFYRFWADYEQGFGDPEKDYWVGLKYWNNITQSEGVQ